MSISRISLDRKCLHLSYLYLKIDWKTGQQMVSFSTSLKSAVASLPLLQFPIRGLIMLSWIPSLRSKVHSTRIHRGRKVPIRFRLRPTGHRPARDNNSLRSRRRREAVQHHHELRRHWEGDAETHYQRWPEG